MSTPTPSTSRNVKHEFLNGEIWTRHEAGPGERLRLDSVGAELLIDSLYDGVFDG